MNYFIEGILLQASLILALGAQNIFVLESGLKKNSPFLVASICSLCDCFLILLGVLGASSFFLEFPKIKLVFGILGVIFLLFYSTKKIREGLYGSGTISSDSAGATSFKKALLLSLGFSLLNPHVYLDTIILIGSYASTYPLLENRLMFGVGAGLFSVIWFFGLIIFSSTMNRHINNPKIMKRVSLLAGILLILMSLKLGSEVLSWIK